MLIRTKTAGLWAAAILILSMPMAFAEGGNGGNFSGSKATARVPEHQNARERIFKALELTEDQKKQMDDIRNKERDAVKPILGQIRSNKDAIKQELSQASFDMTKVNSLQGQIKALQGQLEDIHLNAMLEIKKVLTAQQYSKFLNMRMEHKEQKMQKMQKKK